MTYKITRNSNKNSSLRLFHSWLLSTTARTIPNMLTTLAVAGLIIGSTPGVAFAIDVGATPQDGKVVAGSADFSNPSLNNLIINQKTQRVVIDWESFNIGTQASTEFKQPKSSSLAINRVTGKSGDPTQILGTLNSNGRVMVLDSNGVLFGKTARIDVGGIIASTGSIDVNQVMSGTETINITNITSGSVINEGQITAQQGGLVAFVAPCVVNSGVISAKLGRVELASGSTVTIDLYGDKLVELSVNGALADAFVENSGTIMANGGRVALTAEAAQSIVNDVINMTGIIRANTIHQTEGIIVLDGGDGGTVHVSGEIEATTLNKSDKIGGRVDITGDYVFMDDAQINVSGNHGGGMAYIGGGLHGEGINTANITDVSAGTVINADAITKGDGGTVVIWGNERTNYYGTTTAHGGAKSGDGGLVEVSTGLGVVFAGMVKTTAANGKVGTLLIDPASVYIGNEAQLEDGSYLNAANIATSLVFSSVIVQATSDIGIVNDVDLATSPYGTPAYDLTLTAPTFNLNNNINMSLIGGLTLSTNTLNLAGKITAGGTMINPTRVKGSATQVNILNNLASIQQGMDISSKTAPVTVQVSAGQYNENLTITKALTLRGDVGTGEEGAGVNAPELFGTIAGGNVITVTANNVNIEGLHLNAQVGDGSVADSVNGISANGVDSLKIDHNNLEGFAALGVAVTDSTNVTLSENNNIPSPPQQVAVDTTIQALANVTTAYATVETAVTLTIAQAEIVEIAANAAATAEVAAITAQEIGDRVAAQAAADIAATAAEDAAAASLAASSAMLEALAAAAEAQAAADIAVAQAALSGANAEALAAAAEAVQIAADTVAAAQIAEDTAQTAADAADAAAEDADDAQAAADATETPDEEGPPNGDNGNHENGNHYGYQHDNGEHDNGLHRGNDVGHGKKARHENNASENYKSRGKNR